MNESVPTEPPVVRVEPGGAVLVAVGDVAVLLDCEVEHELVRNLWRELTSGARFDQVVESLARRGPLGLPSFGLTELAGGAARVLVRGSVQAWAGGEVVTAEDVRTWVERRIDPADSVVLGNGPLSAEASSMRFWVSSGVVPASRVSMVRDPSGAHSGPALADASLLAPPAPALLPPIVAAPGPVPESIDDVLPPDAWTRAAVEPDVPDDAEDPSEHGESLQDEGPADGGAPDARSEEELAGPTDAATIVGPLADLLLEGGDDGGDGDGSGAADGEGAAVDALPEPDGAGEPADGHAGAGEIGEPVPDAALVDHGSSSLPAPDDGGGYDHLFGATRARSVEDAAVRIEEDDDAGPDPTEVISAVPGAPQAVPPPGSPAPPPSGSDHDGMTISLSQLRAQMDAPPPGSPAAPTSFAGDAPLLSAVRCPVDHLNPPHAGLCRVCGSPVAEQEPVTVARPVLGQLRFPDDRVVPLTRSVVLGRAPRVQGEVGPDAAVPVAVESPRKEISSTHVEIKVEGWQILVIDRRSTNGTTVHIPGRVPQRLRAGEPASVPLGTTINLADEIELLLEAAP